ncbi:hypothetical protein JCM16303_003289 [Sporobolomyces ruberrimus]
MPHDTPYETPTVEKLALWELISGFDIRGQKTIKSVEHEEFDLVPDGWAAAMWVAYKYTQGGFLRNLLLLRPCKPEDIIMESFAVLNPSTGEVALSSVNGHSQRTASEYWTKVCQAYKARGEPDEIVRTHWFNSAPATPSSSPTSTSGSPQTDALRPGPTSSSSRLRSNANSLSVPPSLGNVGLATTLHVRYHEPLSYPFPLDANDRLFAFEPDFVSKSFTPTSPIFFASRFERLRQLYALICQENPHQDPSRRPSAQYTKLLTDVFSTLISMLLYFLAIVDSGNTLSHFGFDYLSWKAVYRACRDRGSEVFGIKKGFGENGKFLRDLNNEGKLEELFRGASEWWIQEEGVQDREGRKMIVDTLVLMKNGLLRILSNRRILRDFPELGPYFVNPYRPVPRQSFSVLNPHKRKR